MSQPLRVLDKTARLLCEALRRSKSAWTLQDVWQEIQANRAQLWLGENAVVVTDTALPDCLNVWLYAGDLTEMRALDTSAAAYAKTLGLSKMTVIDGRKGWARVLAPLGYKKHGSNMLVKEI